VGTETLISNLTLFPKLKKKKSNLTIFKECFYLLDQYIAVNS